LDLSIVHSVISNPFTFAGAFPVIPDARLAFEFNF
jgi:hypothetical protein